MKTLVNALELGFKQFATQVAIEAPECRLSYAELDELTSQLASKLVTRCGDLLKQKK